MPGKILLIARACYPSNAAGAHRPVKAAKFLAESGWDPVILCADWSRAEHPEWFDPRLAREDDVCRTVRVPYPAPAGGRVGRAARRFVTSLFPYSTPRSAVRSFSDRAWSLVEAEGTDVVWSTYSPGFTHLVASRIAALKGMPWVADFRDIPDQVYDSALVRRNVRFEVAVCAAASAITTTSHASAERLTARHRAPVEVVLNGFDPDDYDPEARPSDAVFDIAYYGTLYEYFDPRPVFRALDLLLARGSMDVNRVVLEFYGPPARQIDELAAGFECARVVHACPRIPYREMLRRQQESSVLLVLKAPTSGTAIPSKVFEYLGAHRPVLCVPGDRGEVDEILAKTGAGVSAGDPEQIAEVLARWYGEWSDAGAARWRGIPDRLQRYSRREQTRRLARVLDSILIDGGGHRAGEERLA